MAQSQEQEQLQGQNQNQDQLIYLSTSGTSYFYQGKRYRMHHKKYRIETNEAFNEKCSEFNASLLKIQTELNTIHANAQDTPWRLFDEAIGLNQAFMRERIMRIFVFNRNFHLIFKCNGMRYSLNGIHYSILTEVKNVLMTLITSKKKYGLKNKGIREANVFIEIMRQQLEFNREKMITVLPRLLGHGVDSNIATIIYDYCF